MTPLVAFAATTTGCALILVAAVAAVPEIRDRRTHSLHPDLPPKGAPVQDAIIIAVIVLVGAMFIAIADVYTLPPEADQEDPDVTAAHIAAIQDHRED